VCSSDLIKGPSDSFFLENQQLEPTHKVSIDPESAAKGVDTQVGKAVEVLLEQLDSE